MNDEKLIWEAYTNKNKDPYRQEVDRVMEMFPDEYEIWKKELHDKLNQVEFDSPEYNHLIGLELALENEYIPKRELWERIQSEADDETRGAKYNDKFREDLSNIIDSAHVNSNEYSGSPSYYMRCIRTLQSNLADSEYSTPEVRAWFKKHFNLQG